MRVFITPSAKSVISLSIDLGIAFTVAVVGVYLRLGNDLHIYINDFINHDAIFVLSALVSNFVFNIYRGIWRYFNPEYLIRYFKYATLTVLLFTLILFFTNRLESFPRSVIFIDWGLLILATAAPRMLYTMYRVSSIKAIFRKSSYLPNLVLIVGVSRSVEVLIEELKRMPNPPYRIVGILDNKKNIGRLLSGIPIINEIKNLREVVENLTNKNQRPVRILVGSEAHISGLLQDLISISKELAIPISRLPKLTELSHNISGATVALQPIAVEDLLRRSQRNLNFAEIKLMITGKSILVTGAGGSIGSEIVRQCAQFEAKEIHLLDSSEFLLYEIEQECKQKFANITFNAHLTDIRDEHDVSAILDKIDVDIVFHAAALKHVPMLENHKLQAISTNIIGTINVVKAALKKHVEKIVFISTDKAVNPLSFMGLTKKVAELFCSISSNEKTKISIVRFGNVLGSNGSVVPLFEKQIASGGPITVTHPEATRYFMTIPEAVGLVLQAAALASPSHKCNTYVLNMGEPVKILDLAEQMITLAGLKAYEDIKIEFTGLRPGEKLHEILVTEHESLVNTESNDIYLAPLSKITRKDFNDAMEKLNKGLETRDEKFCEEIIKILARF
ncbi:MAG: nucleotide sugar dehydratase [Candidatus Midichloriaceae bacterium]|jgi:O-antigen biosynthesis protein WbqV|nr:nucleotide sugar dehydratase [Candidatus Midichloriaceae bacterium]